MKKLKLLLLALVLASSGVKAEPSSAVKLLMSEPMSLFDYGMHQLREYVEGLHTPAGRPSYLETNYNWEENRIVIIFDYINELAAESRDSAKLRCRMGIIRLMRGLGASENNIEGVLVSFFSHEGYNTDKTGQMDIERSWQLLSKLSGVSGF